MPQLRRLNGCIPTSILPHSQLKNRFIFPLTSASYTSMLPSLPRDLFCSKDTMAQAVREVILTISLLLRAHPRQVPPLLLELSHTLPAKLVQAPLLVPL